MRIQKSTSCDLKFALAIIKKMKLTITSTCSHNMLKGSKLVVLDNDQQSLQGAQPE